MVNSVRIEKPVAAFYFIFLHFHDRCLLNLTFCRSSTHTPKKNHLKTSTTMPPKKDTKPTQLEQLLVAMLAVMAPAAGQSLITDCQEGPDIPAIGKISGALAKRWERG
jgi:hypothetical protein